MIIEDQHKRIAAMHVTKKGVLALVWMARDPESDHLHIYDACTFPTEVPAVIADGINARGRNIPIAWTHKEMSETLLGKGCRMLHDPAKNSDEAAEMAYREIWERMRTKRISFDKRLKDWLQEAEGLERVDGVVPADESPLMAATQIAIQQIDRARAVGRKRQHTTMHKKVAIV